MTVHPNGCYLTAFTKARSSLSLMRQCGQFCRQVKQMMQNQPAKIGLQQGGYNELWQIAHCYDKLWPEIVLSKDER
jgi:hypothetical protein